MTKKRRNWLIIIGIVVALIGGSIFASANKKSKIEYTTASVTRGSLVQTVNETGTITPAKEIELNFLNSGQLTQINVKVGDQVSPEQALGQIDSSGLAIREQEAGANLSVTLANVAQSQSNLDSARRDYDRQKASLQEALNQAEKTQRDLEDKSSGTVTTYEQAVITAESGLISSKSTYQRGIDNKAAALGLTVENKLASGNTSLDAINRILTDSDARPTLSIQNSSYLNLATLSYDSAKDLMSQAMGTVTAYKTNKNFLDSSYSSTQTALSKVSDALSYTYNVLTNSIASSSFTQTKLDSYKTSIDSQITITSSSISSLQSAKQALEDAKLQYETSVLAAEQAVSQARASYDSALKTSRNAVASARTNRDQQLASAQARVDSAGASLSVVSAQIAQAQANVDLVRNQLKDTILKSPIKGVVTKVNYQVGEQVTPQKSFLSVLTENNFQLEIDIAETDINKVKQNNQASIVLDSFGEANKFTGTVYFIEPAATIIQGVTYYKVKISFDPGTQPVKPGMTASAIITTAKLDNVLMMPSRAIVERDNAKFVRILENETPREVSITTGLSGDDGMVEVTSGVKEGDNVVTFVKDPSKK
jgi:HlyD family secretion protein